MKLEREASPRSLGLCPRGRDWPGLTHAPERWPGVPAIYRRQRGEESGGARKGSRRGGGPCRRRGQERFREERMRFSACRRWEGGQGR